jgi:hypothetical protein
MSAYLQPLNLDMLQLRFLHMYNKILLPRFQGHK